MPFGNYAELQAAVKRWIKRSDLDGDIRDFIALAEARMSHDIADLPPMQRSAIVTTTPGQRSIPLPEGWMWAKYAKCVGGRDLDVVVPEAIDGSPHTGGRPRRIAYAGGVAMVDPLPDAAHPITLAYVARIPALSNDAPINWVLQQAPQMYLYASLLEAMPFVAYDERAATWAGAYKVALDALREQRWLGNPKLQHDPVPTGHGGFDIVTG